MALITGTTWTKDGISLTLVDNSYGNGIYSEAPKSTAPASWCKFNPALKMNLAASSDTTVSGIDIFASLEDDIGVEDGDFYGNPILIKRYYDDNFRIDIPSTNPYTQYQLSAIDPAFTVKGISSATTYYIFIALNSNRGYSIFKIGSIVFYPLVHLGYVLDTDNTQTKFYLGEPLAANIKLYETLRYDGTYFNNDSEQERNEVTPTVVFPDVSNGAGNYTVTVKHGSTTAGTYTISILTERYTDYVITTTYKIATNVSTVVRDNTTFYFGKRFVNGELAGECYPLYEESKLTNGLLSNGDENTNKNTDCVGYVDFGIDKNAHVVLFEDPENPMRKEDKTTVSNNITVTFPNYDEKQANRINKAQFGIIYNNRLFVSGNPDFKNCDWHTQPINDADYDTTHDYTYFSDLDYCYYGGDDTAVVGYDIFRDGDLIVAKEGSRNQASLYRRSYKLVNAMSYDGTMIEDQVEESFPMFDINSNGGEGGLSPRSITNFVGETVILTKTGLKSLVTNEDIKNNAKYLVNISSLIDPKITREELENAFLYTYKEKLLLKTSRGVYIGYYELKDGNEYEWFFDNGINADMFFEYDDELYFANNEGKIYRFPKEKYDEENKLIPNYQDVDRYFVSWAGVLSSNSNNFYLNKRYNIQNGDEFLLLAEDGVNLILANVEFYLEQSGGGSGSGSGSGSQVGGGISIIQPIIVPNFTPPVSIQTYLDNGSAKYKLVVSSSYSRRFYDGQEVNTTNWKNSLNVTMNGMPETCVLRRMDADDPYNYKIYQKIWGLETEVSLNNVKSFTISTPLTENLKTTVKNVVNVAFGGTRFELYDSDDQEINFETGSTFQGGVITRRNNYSAYYWTIPYSFGTLSNMKTIWSWTIANDTDLASYMDVGYLTSVNQGGAKVDWSIKATSGSRREDLWSGMFDTVQFTSDLLPHIYARFRTVPLVNFIRFGFFNDQDTNMVLSALEVTYSISEFSRGSK